MTRLFFMGEIAEDFDRERIYDATGPDKCDVCEHELSPAGHCSTEDCSRFDAASLRAETEERMAFELARGQTP